MDYPNGYESVHYTILPAPKFWNSPSKLNFELTFSGVALTNLKGNNDGSWNRDTIQLSIADMGFQKVFERAQSLLPPIPANFIYGFVPLQWNAFASPNAMFDKEHSVNAGFAADRFSISKFIGENAANQTLNFLGGMNVDLAVKDKDAYIYRVGYFLTCYGYFELYQVPIVT